MTAQPEDPSAIFEALPPSHRAWFRAEYDEALDAAHDLARLKQVQALLRQWRLRAIAYARPGYEEAVQDALQDRTEMFTRYTPPEWEGRVRRAGVLAAPEPPTTVFVASVAEVLDGPIELIARRSAVPPRWGYVRRGREAGRPFLRAPGHVAPRVR